MKLSEITIMEPGTKRGLAALPANEIKIYRKDRGKNKGKKKDGKDFVGTITLNATLSAQMRKCGYSFVCLSEDASYLIPNKKNMGVKVTFPKTDEGGARVNSSVYTDSLCKRAGIEVDCDANFNLRLSKDLSEDPGCMIIQMGKEPKQ